MDKAIISCPNCGLEQARSDECIRCGIIFRKFRERVRQSSETSDHSSLPTGKTAAKRSGGLFRKIRIFILLLVLFIVATDYWRTKLRVTDWDQPLLIIIYPINGDGSGTVSHYIDSIAQETFEPIEHFIEQQAERYGMALTHPITVALAPEIYEVPPKQPPDDNMLNVIWWSLKLRYWAHKVDTYTGAGADIRIFVVYYDPKVHKQLNHSLGLEKGLVAVVNAFAVRRMESQNNVILVHELLHTLGATDKYNLATEQPVYPDGYAEPDRQPLFPQEKGEIMSGRIPLSKARSEMPKGLEYTVIGKKTAMEIRWVE